MTKIEEKAREYDSFLDILQNIIDSPDCRISKNVREQLETVKRYLDLSLPEKDKEIEELREKLDKQIRFKLEWERQYWEAQQKLYDAGIETPPIKTNRQHG